jgi:uncharacterized protein (TIGR03086 family)
MDGIIDRFRLAGAGFEARLRAVGDAHWDLPTPCAEWTVRRLVNHVARGNLNYAALARGATGEDFLRMRDADALGDDPLGAYRRSLAECAAAFDGALDRVLDYPLGAVTGAQALAVRATDTVVHTWDLARAVGADETLDRGLVGWIDAELSTIYAGLAESPVSAGTTHRFFAAPRGHPGPSAQDRLLHRMGRGTAGHAPTGDRPSAVR